LDLIIRKLKTSKGLRERSIISSFRKSVLERAHAELPEIPRLLLMRRWPVRIQRFERWAFSIALFGIGLESGGWTPARAAKTKALGLTLTAWEPYRLRSSARRAAKLRALGVDIAIVNQPRAYLEGRSLKPTSGD